MKTEDLFEETYSAVTVNKVRSGLTMLGIVIGIASVIALQAVGQGAQSSIQSSIQSLGANLIMVTPGAQKTIGTTVSTGLGSAETLTADDATAISQLPDVTAVAPEVSGRYQVVYKGQNTNVSVMGTTSAYPTVRNVQVADGSFVTDTDNTESNLVAVIGPTVLQTLFAPSANASATPDMAIGQNILIKGNVFTVVGVTVSKGGSGFNNQDDMIYVPLTTAQHYLIGSTAYVTEVDVEASSQNDMTTVQNDITSLLLQRHNISDPTQADFTVLNQQDIVSAASSVTGTFTTLLAAIAGISLVVGGIGIMNMMLTTVTERTREIGLRKAIGAKKNDITMQFLAEAVTLTFGGGIIGIVLGWLAALLISTLTGTATSVSLSSIILAFCVSAGIGIVFGYYPARRAASLSPIEALRYE
ncbi:MAG TPA: ABC transporter permease [Candidatus Paceibacterota bacterium]|jgi:putative ABC transport system permease protein|nr:ABC transporter permease [Candidatus Paceibacterota bacterium]